MQTPILTLSDNIYLVVSTKDDEVVFIVKRERRDLCKIYIYKYVFRFVDACRAVSTRGNSEYGDGGEEEGVARDAEARDTRASRFLSRARIFFLFNFFLN